MIRFAAIFIAFNLLIGCTKKDASKQQSAETASAEVDSRRDSVNSENTLPDRVQSSAETNDSTDGQRSLSVGKGEERRLRYLFYANGGLVGYFSDGAVAGCPRCELLKENVEALYTEKPFKNYTVEHDGSLLVNGKERIVPKEKEENGNREWAMIDYQWIINPK